MYESWRTLAGVCNLVFTAAMAALARSRWPQLETGWRGLLILAVCWFPLIKPVLVYLKMKRLAAGNTAVMQLAFGEAGVEVHVSGETCRIPWPKVKQVQERASCLSLLLDDRHSYIIPNRVLGEQRELLYNYVVSRLK